MRALAAFAKDPQPGTVKTRLVPPLTHREAASLARAFVTDTGAVLVRATATIGAAPFVFATPSDAVPVLRELVPAGVDVRAQCSGDLGARLASAADELAAAGFDSVCFIGTDSPTLPLAFIARAFERLEAGADVAIGPADDGGYYLIALRGARRAVFEGMDWSTGRVFAQTCARAAALGLDAAVLPSWYDVDDAVSLRRLHAELLAHGEGATQTRVVLASFANLASDRTRNVTLR